MERPQSNTALDQFISTTSMHGCAHLTSSSSNKVTILWTCIIVVALFGTGFHLYNLINLYLEYEYYESVRTEYNSFEFPDITMCPSEAYSHYTVFQNSDFAAKIMIESIQLIMSLKEAHFKSPEEKQVMFGKIASMEGSYALLTNSTIDKVGISKDELIVDCIFQDRLCSQDGYFMVYHHYLFFNCYTFRLNISPDVHTKINTGPENGLSLILKGNNMANFVYDPRSRVGNVNGIRVAVHEQGSMPPLLQQGFFIQPGTSTDIGLIMKKYERLDRPYGRCQQTTSNYSDSGFIYSEELCEVLHLAEETQIMCGCQSMKYHTMDNNLKNRCLVLGGGENVSRLIEKVLCDTHLASTKGLGQSQGKAHSRGIKECPWPCEEIAYPITKMSQAKWPLRSMVEHFIQIYISPLPCDSPVQWFHRELYRMHGLNYSKVHPGSSNCTNDIPSPEQKTFTVSDYEDAVYKAINGVLVDYYSNATFKITMDPTLKSSTIEEAEHKWISEYFYRLNVYFAEPTVEIHKQVVSLSTTDLLSNVGGVLGLWIGISFVTIIEMCGFLGRLLKTTVHGLGVKIFKMPMGSSKVTSVQDST